MDIPMVTAKMLAMGDMCLWAGEADMQVSPIVLDLFLALGALGDGQALDWPELEGRVAALAAVEGRVWHRGKPAQVWTLVPKCKRVEKVSTKGKNKLVPVLTIRHILPTELTPGKGKQ